MNYRKKLTLGAEKLNIDLNKTQVEQFMDYLNLIQKWNQQINLTAVDSADKIVVKHFLDSLSLLAELKLDGTEKIIDVGTGAGLPGLPLKIVYPELTITLLEAVKKKVTFVRRAVYRLNLEGVEVIHGRAEDYGQQEEYREQYDYGLARAVAKLNILGEYTLPFVQQGGKFIAYKGREISKEINSSQQAIEQLGGEITETKVLNLPFSEAERNLVLIDKKHSTSNQYPRSAGIPDKNPLEMEG